MAALGYGGPQSTQVDSAGGKFQVSIEAKL